MVYWLVDEIMQRRALPTGRPSLVEAARSLGFQAEWSPMSFDCPLPFEEGSTVVLHGSKQGLARIRERMGGRWTLVAFDRYAAHAPTTVADAFGSDMLNASFDILNWAEFVATAPTRWPEGVFVRPDDGGKAFAGTALARRALSGLPALPDSSTVPPETRVVAASLRRLLGESRFLIVDGEVVTGSTYRWGGRLDVRADVPEESLALAASVAAGGQGPDRAFVCDVALVDSDPVEAKIVECNTVSTSGTYACDTLAWVRSISRIAAESR